MSTVTDKQIVDYVEAHIGAFHENRLKALQELKLKKLLRRKNHYLFKSKNITIATDLIRSLLDAHLNSQEETLFGHFLEGLAIYVAGIVYGAQKSMVTGIDLEFSTPEARYIVSIKSGPNWGNSSQIKKMTDNFARATQLARQGDPKANIIAVNGCCYGSDKNPAKKGYFKYCGQEFWTFISGDSDLYTRIIEPLGHNAKQHNQNFSRSYGAIINLLSKEFSEGFCAQDGSINWPKLVEFNSAKRS